MPVARRTELASSLAALLAEATAEQHLDGGGRLAWLAHHLSLYTQRLVAFAAVQGIHREALIQSDLFIAVEVGAAAVEAELVSAALAGGEYEAWARVRTAIDDVCRAGTAEGITTLSERVQAWKAGVAPVKIATRLSNDR